VILFEVQSFSANGTTVNKKPHYFQNQRKIKDSKFLILIIEQISCLIIEHPRPIIHKNFKFLAAQCKKLQSILQKADSTYALRYTSAYLA